MKRAIIDPNSPEARWNDYLAGQMKDYDRKALRKLLNTKEGRWFFVRLLEITGYRSQSFTGNSQTFYNEGKRSVGIFMTKYLMDLLGIEGFKGQQQAEKEYVEFQEHQKVLFYSDKGE